ncbi:FG-GAP repeat domain-containing protein [Streptomyces sp. NPDC059443]|uniref:FG-GAP repeat domain-containing protein n=1 Tax=unclassified Streptomyces TaxID=2593676 RepID=UPI00368A3CCB
MLRTKASLVGTAVTVVAALTALSAGPAQSASGGAEAKGTTPAKVIGALAHQGAMDQNPARIFWHNSSTNETQIWFMIDNRIASRGSVADGNGNPIRFGTPWEIEGMADFDRNGSPDILWHNTNTKETEVWYMDGNRYAGRQSLLEESGSPTRVGAPWQIVGVTDFDLNGHPDILWHNVTTNESQIWYMNGTRIAVRQSVVEESGNPTHVGTPWEIAGVGGLNVFGGRDIFWHNTSTNETQIWYMDFNSRIRSRRTVVEESGSPTHVGAPWQIAGVTDFDREGSPDILWHNTSTNETQIWYMNDARIGSRVNVLEESGSPTHVGAPWEIVGSTN